MTFKDDVKNALRTKYNNRERKGIHVSDLINCQRQAVFRKIDPRDITDKELNFFTSGYAIHEAIQTLVDTDDKYEIEKEIKFGDITAHIDVFNKTTHTPIEAKSYRGKTMKEPKKIYVEQLKAYMALTGSDTGIIFVQCLMNFEEDPFIEFDIKMTADQRQEVLERLEYDTALLKSAFMNEDPFIANHVYGNPVFYSSYKWPYNWKCEDCPYQEPCFKEMRIQRMESNDTSTNKV